MAEPFLYLTTVGRTSGLPRTIEIWFVEREGRYYIVAENREATQWVRNLQVEPRVTVSVGARESKTSLVPSTSAHARVVTAAAEPELARAVSSLMDGKYRWSDGLIVELALDVG